MKNFDQLGAQKSLIKSITFDEFITRSKCRVRSICSRSTRNTECTVTSTQWSFVNLLSGINDYFEPVGVAAGSAGITIDNVSDSTFARSTHCAYVKNSEAH